MVEDIHCVLHPALFMVDCNAMTKVLTSLCSVFSPINDLSSRSNFISQSLNNCCCVIRSGLAKLPVDCKRNSTSNSCHGVKYNRWDNHSAEVRRMVWKNLVIFERAAVKICALKNNLIINFEINQKTRHQHIMLITISLCGIQCRK